MGFFDYFKTIWKSKHTSEFTQGFFNNAFSNDFEYSEKNPFYLKSILLISEAVSKAEFIAYNDKGEVVKDDNLVNLINEPNLRQNKIEFLKEFSEKLLKYGWIYIYSEVNSTNSFDAKKLAKAPKLFNLNPKLVNFNTKIERRITDLDVSFDYDNYLNLRYSDIIPFVDWKVSDENQFKGVSRLDYLKNETNLINLANNGDSNRVKLSGQVVISKEQEKDDAIKVSNSVNFFDKRDPEAKSEAKKLEQLFHSKGLGQGRSIFVTDLSLKVLNLSDGINNLDFTPLKKSNGNLYYSVYNIPNGLIENSTYDNRDADELFLYENIAKNIAENFANSLVSYYYHTNKIKVSFEHLEIYRNRKQEQKKSYSEFLKNYIEIINNLVANNNLTVEEGKIKIDNAINNEILS